MQKIPFMLPQVHYTKLTCVKCTNYRYNALEDSGQAAVQPQAGKAASRIRRGWGERGHLLPIPGAPRTHFSYPDRDRGALKSPNVPAGDWGDDRSFLSLLGTGSQGVLPCTN
jgi:hypothetical protein